MKIIKNLIIVITILMLMTTTFMQILPSPDNPQQGNNLQIKGQKNGMQKKQLIKTQQAVNKDNYTSKKLSIYGVRWFLGDYFSYSNQIINKKSENQKNGKHLNRNYYVLAFNSDGAFDQDVYVQILQTQYTCSHRRIEIDVTNDHVPIQLKTNSTLNSTISDIYRCYINSDLSELYQIYEQKNDANKLRKQSSFNPWKQVSYQIYTAEPQFMYKKQTKDVPDNQTHKVNRKIATSYVTLFEGKFRLPIPSVPKDDQKLSTDQKFIKYKKGKISQKILTIGDWGMIKLQIQQSRKYIPILEQVLKKLNQQQNIVMALFLGDLAYDLTGQKYIQMLKYIEPLTSRICFMATPGNHDYIYHQDSFQLFAETFISPQWSKYYNFYYTFVLGDTLFLSYVPENIIYQSNYQIDVKPLQYIKKDLYNNYIPIVYQKQGQNLIKYQKGKIDPIKQQFHVVVFSHFPIFCSKTDDDLKACVKNKVILKQFIQIFYDIGIDVYVSGHLHYYQRTKAICSTQNSTNFFTEDSENTQIQNIKGLQQNIQIYKSKCPVYIIQGSAGNDYWVEPQNSNTYSQYTKKIVGMTGFGSLQLRTAFPNSKSYQRGVDDQVQITHYKMLKINESIIADRAYKILPRLVQYQQTDSIGVYIDSDLISTRIVEIAVIVILIIIYSLICYCYGCCFVRSFGLKNHKRRKTNDHIEMVEENLNSVISEVKANQKKTTEENHEEEEQHNK